MIVAFSRIRKLSTRRLRGAIKQSNFLVDFDSDACSGRAILCIVGTSSNIDMSLLRERFLHKKLQVSVSVDVVSEFTQLSRNGSERIVPLGPTGEFEFEGHISMHLISGEETVFQVDGMQLILNRKMIPDIFEHLEEGGWVSFSAKGLKFWVW